MLSPLRLVVVAAANDDLRDSLFTFGKALATSQWWKDVSAPYRISPTATAVSVVGPAISPGTIPLAEVMAYVQRTAIDSAGFAPDGRTVYLVYLPPGVRCSGGSCDKYTAFHVPFGATDALAVITRNQPGVPPMLAMTFLGSHEVIEAATDPLFDAWRLNSSLQPWNATPWGLDDEALSPKAPTCATGRDIWRVASFTVESFQIRPRYWVAIRVCPRSRPRTTTSRLTRAGMRP